MQWTHNRRAPITAPLGLVFCSHTYILAPIHAFNICTLHEQHAYSQPGPETSAWGCRSTSLLLSSALCLPWSPSFHLSLSASERFLWKARDKRLSSMGAWLQRQRWRHKVLQELLTQDSLHPTKTHAAIVHSLCLCDIRQTLSLNGLYLPVINTMRYIPTEKHKVKRVHRLYCYLC